MTRAIIRILLVLVMAFGAACRTADPADAQLKADTDADAPTAGSPPPLGRSIFDDLIAELGGTVPFPFSKLRRTLTASLQLKTKYALIPYSRSLQQLSVSPAQPRIILGVTGFGRPSRLDSEVPYPDVPMLIAYSEGAKALEVISFNDRLGRYEFQIVKDYEKAKTPEVRYANRSLCTQCHQGEVPVFPPPNWEETNHSGAATVAMKTAIGAASYLGFKVQAMSFNLMQEFDGLSSTGADVVNAHALVNRCAKTDAVVECRRTLMGLLLFHQRSFGPASSQWSDRAIYDSAPYQANARTMVNKLLGSGGLAMQSSRIEGRDPKPAAPHAMTAAQNPKTPRPTTPLKKGNDAWKTVAYTLRTTLWIPPDDAAYLFDWADKSYARILNLLKRPRIEAALAGEVFSWAGFLQALGEETAEHTVALRCCHASPEAAAPPPDSAPEAPSSSVAGRFRQYCEGCHTGNGEAALDFMQAASDTALLTGLKANAEVARRLDWESVDASDRMPPPYSSQGKALKLRPDDLKALRQALDE